MTSFPHRCTHRLRLAAEADSRAPGGAVTVALCGHWDHAGPCRWPHRATLTPTGDGTHRLQVDFDAPAAEVDEVLARVEAAVNTGELTGPDGRWSRWTVAD